MAVVTCPDPGCVVDGEPRQFASEGALRFHNNAKHGGREGDCPECGKHFGNLASHMRVHRRADVEAPAATEPVDEVEAPVAGPVFESEERPPVFGPYTGPEVEAPASRLTRRRGRPSGRLRERVQARVWGKTDGPPPGGGAGYEAPTAEKRPRSKGGSRADTTPIFSMAWGGLGALLMRTGADVPVGRTLQFQQDMAGDVLDRLIARTWVDRIIQPLARKTDDVEALGALLALPALVAVIERSDEAAVAMAPVLREAVKANLAAMAPAIKRRKDQEKKYARAVEDLNLGLPPGADPIDSVLAAIFAPPPDAPAEPEPQGAGASANGA